MNKQLKVLSAMALTCVESDEEEVNSDADAVRDDPDDTDGAGDLEVLLEGQGVGDAEERNLYSAITVAGKRLLTSWPLVEVKELLKLSLPTIVMLFFQQFTQVIAILFAGHISQSSRELDAVVLAVSVNEVTGIVVVNGLSSAAESLCPQNFGSKNYKKVGEVFQQGTLILLVSILPVAALWIGSEPILLLLQQPPCVVRLTSQFLMIFSLFLPAFVLMTMLQKYLSAQSVVWIFAWTGLLMNILTAVFCAIFLYGFHFGTFSVAVAVVLAAYLSLFFLLAYIKLRNLHKLTWGGCSVKSLQNWWVFLKLGIPGLFLTGFEWWVYEISLFVTGSINEVELGVNGILLQLLNLVYMFSYGTGLAASVRVGNELGAGNPIAAKRSAYTGLCLQVVIGGILVLVLGAGHEAIGRLFTNDEEVIAKTSYTIYLALVVIFFDQIQGISAGVFRGAGLQVVAAPISFVAFYVIGMPVGICLALLTDLGAFGMWIGLAIGAISQSLSFVLILFTRNWTKLAEKATKLVSTDNKNLSEPSVAESSLTTLVEDTNDISEESVLEDENANGQLSVDESMTSLITTDPKDEECAVSSDGEPLVSTESKESPSLSSLKLAPLLLKLVALLVGVGLVVLAGVLAGVVRNDELEQSCVDSISCCNNSLLLTSNSKQNISSASFIQPSSVAVSCVCSSAINISPTPFYT